MDVAVVAVETQTLREDSKLRRDAIASQATRATMLGTSVLGISEMLAKRSAITHKRSENAAHASQLLSALGGRRASYISANGSAYGSRMGSRPTSARGKKVMPVD